MSRMLLSSRGICWYTEKSDVYLLGRLVKRLIKSLGGRGGGSVSWSGNSSAVSSFCPPNVTHALQLSLSEDPISRPSTPQLMRLLGLQVPLPRIVREHQQAVRDLTLSDENTDHTDDPHHSGDPNHTDETDQPKSAHETDGPKHSSHTDETTDAGDPAAVSTTALSEGAAEQVAATVGALEEGVEGDESEGDGGAVASTAERRGEEMESS
jgi:hypothetical protein